MRHNASELRLAPSMGRVRAHVDTRRARGLTLVELMITLAVAMALLLIGVPSFQSTVANNRVTTATNSLVAHVTLARSEAVKRVMPVTICASTDGVTCSGSNGWETGWIVFTDQDTPGAIDAGDELLRVVGAQPGSLSIAGDAPTMRYLPDGAVEI